MYLLFQYPIMYFQLLLKSSNFIFIVIFIHICYEYIYQNLYLELQNQILIMLMEIFDLNTYF